MLNKLTIKNVALIDAAEIIFTSGLNVLSGETGSGKSVILESLNFALGAKADKSLIRSGETECFVSAEFDVSENFAISEIFNELDIEKDDTLIITRKLNIDGKGSIKVNGSTVTVGMLKRFTSNLVDVHGQSEHFYLLKSSNQLELIDKVGGESVRELKIAVKESYDCYKKLLDELGSLGGDEAQRAIRLDILNFQIDEIERCDLKDGEEEELLEAKGKLQNQEKILNALYSVKSAVDSDGGISDIIANAEKAISNISAFSEEYSNLYSRISDVRAELSDIADTASDFIDGVDVGGLSLEKVEDRLYEIKNIKRKYGGDFNAVYDFLEKSKKEKGDLENYTERAEKLLLEKERILDKLYSQYKKLSDLRRETSKRFSENILEELKELSISKARFYVDFNEFPSRECCNFNSGNGIDEIKFMFSANLGEPVKPLSEVISGGEMSRFMLAMKTQTAKYNNISTFVFDEIDAGISGGVAKTVAEKFAKISIATQVIAITHLPQISAMADNNLLISKSENELKTLTSVKKLLKDEKVFEIMRLVGGEFESVSAKKHAEELIDSADRYKQSLK